MRQFFKIFFASLLALIAGVFLSILILFGIISLAVSSSNDSEVVINNNSVLKISFSDPIVERSTGNPFELIDFNDLRAKHQPGLNDILKSIDKAAKDDKIKGIYIDMPDVQGGMAKMENLRNALLKFKKSNKFIYAYAENYSQGAYYIASVSDKIYLNPKGIVDLHGLMTELMFFKGTFDKLEIQPRLIRHGKFKGAGEAFIMDKMSPENKAQITGFVENIWNNIAGQIAKSRDLPAAMVHQIADSLLVRNADDAIKYKLVDQLAYFDEFTNDINLKLGKKSGDKISSVSLNKYKDAADPLKRKYTDARIAVIYAVGEIESGEGSDGNIGADALSSTIRKARNDKSIKAIVLRVNSPGGSALASEIIWREVTLAAQSKPLVVSMGDVAASGGYYISCGATKIMAQPNTITGSIGVFGLLFNAQNMFKNKLGITFDGYKTGMYTDLGSITRPMTIAEENIIQHSVDQVYNTFTQRVSEGRKIPVDLVDSLGQGRVWSGTDALKYNLVDTLGGLEDAIKMVASMARLDNYRVKEMPEKKKALQQLMEDFSAKARVWIEEKELGQEAIYLKTMRSILRAKGLQTRMEYEIFFQ